MRVFMKYPVGNSFLGRGPRFLSQERIWPQGKCFSFFPSGCGLQTGPCLTKAHASVPSAVNALL